MSFMHLPTNMIMIMRVAPWRWCVTQVYLSGAVSSQYLTALLMAAPLAVPGGAGGDAIEVRKRINE